MKQFKLINNISAGIIFLIAMITYGLTIEPTASFWDCSEFISTAFKLDVGHPPGAPFFMLTGNFFSLFASDTTQVAYMINMMSAFLSALTILFLFLSITHLARKVMVKDGKGMDLSQLITIIGSGTVGALAYTFSDTFWFSAVEGEVYAYSSFLTAVVFWLILKWEERSNDTHSDRYLILIAYVMGVSICVHLLNLLTIPAIGLVYYFKKTKNPNGKGILIALLTSAAILLGVLYGLVPGFVSLAGYVELFFVNTLGLPFNSGALFYLFITVGAIIWAILELYKEKRSLLRIQISSLLTIALLGVPFIMGSFILATLIIGAIIFYFYKKKDKLNIRVLSTIIVSLAMIVIGYSGYGLIVIRSLANPPMDQNSPDNVFALKNYLNREQYGDRPLFYGAYYSAKPKLEVKGEYCQTVIKEGAKNWGQKEKLSDKEKDTYIVASTKQTVEYDRKFKTLFPRLHSSNANHIRAYKQWVPIQGRKVKYDACGRSETIIVPTFLENINFFFTYQLNYMYWRYFMWNFSGRQNDIQGHGEVTNGNWITGFNFIDKYTVGDQATLSPEYKNNKAHNKYYMLPLILGIIGMVFQLFMSGKKGKESFIVTFTLFFMTGIAIVLYLNQGPSEPRERDYAYAGSFYAFAIWIGLSVAGISKWLSDRKINKLAAASFAFLICLPVPALMLSENWDDHDRSNRYVARDFGMNYFNSCADDAILFTFGDNDTFPLWYLQETEGLDIATDKRVCNLSYLNTDWYIDQMRRPAYNSDALPISWERSKYADSNRNVAYLRNLTGKPLDLKISMDFLASDDPKTKIDPKSGNHKDFLPATSFTVPVNADNVINQGAVKEEDRANILPQIKIDLSTKSYVQKNELMILNMIAENNWERPIYYAATVSPEVFLDLKKYFRLEGMAYRITPIQGDGNEGTINTDLMYTNMMTKFKFGNINDPKVYLDENTRRMCRVHRHMFINLITALIEEGENEKAKKAIDYCLEMIPGHAIKHGYSSIEIVEDYYKLGETEKARALMAEISDNAEANLNWLFGLNDRLINRATTDISQNLHALQLIALTTREQNDTESFTKYYDVFVKYADQYQAISQ